MIGIHATVHGNLVNDAVYKEGTEGKGGYLYFTVAVTKPDRTSTHFVKVFSGGSQKFASSLTKGTHVMVIGSLDAKIYVSQTHGNSIDLTINADYIDFGGSRKTEPDPNDDKPF